MSRLARLQAMLEAEPDDVFLQYAVAKQYESEGDDGAAMSRYALLAANHPDYVPTYLQWAQLLIKAAEEPAAAQVLKRGVEQARRAGDDHAMGEMSALLDQLPSS